MHLIKDRCLNILLPASRFFAESFKGLNDGGLLLPCHVPIISVVFFSDQITCKVVISVSRIVVEELLVTLVGCRLLISVVFFNDCVIIKVVISVRRIVFKEFLITLGRFCNISDVFFLDIRLILEVVAQISGIVLHQLLVALVGCRLLHQRCLLVQRFGHRLRWERPHRL